MTEEAKASSEEVVADEKERLDAQADAVARGEYRPFVVNLAGERSVAVRKRDAKGELRASLDQIRKLIKQSPEKIDKAELRALVEESMEAAREGGKRRIVISRDETKNQRKRRRKKRK